MAKNGVKGWKYVFRLIDITIDIFFFSINWKNYFDRSILVILMTVLVDRTTPQHVLFPLTLMLLLVILVILNDAKYLKND